MKVLVLYGGKSDEREVSLRSGAEVINALKSLNHEVVEYDPVKGYSGLNDYVGKVDIVLPILHGKYGEDGEVQSELEKRKFKYLGSDSKVSALCFDKDAFKKQIIGLGFDTPAGELVSHDTIGTSKFFSRPYVLKPVDGGSSIDTFVARQPGSQRYETNVFDRHPTMLIEELIEGSEITVPILGATALPVIEIIPPEGLEFDYENKYNGATQELCPPKHVSLDHQHRAQTIAETIHNRFGVRHLSRTDLIIDKAGKLYVLELNTMPGLTSQSLYPKAAQVAGLDFENLVEKLLESAA